MSNIGNNNNNKEDNDDDSKRHRIINYDKLNPPADWNPTPAMIVSYIQFLCPCCYYINIDLITLSTMASIFHLCVVYLFFCLLSFKERKRDETSNGIPIRGETLIGMRIRNPVSSILLCTRIASSILHNWGEGGGGGGESKLYSIFVTILLLY